MKESPPPGHPCVAAPPERTTRGTRRQQQLAAAATTPTPPTNNNTDLVNKNQPAGDNDSDSEGDWDVGVGNLVIDLDADLERHQGSPVHAGSAPPVPLTTAAASTSTPPRVLSGKMSSVEHHAVVDKGLKMKIKRKNVGAKSSDVKHEIVKAADAKLAAAGGSTNSNAETTNQNAANMPASVPNSPMDKQKHGANSENKEKATKGRGAHKKEKGRANKGAEPVANGTQFHPPTGSTNTSAGAGAAANSTTIPISLANKFTGNVSVDIYPIPAPFNIKKETPAEDPYEFNAKVEDGGRPLSFPVKKIKVEKPETAPSAMVTSPSTAPTQDVGVETCCAATITDPDCLGPCEPGTAVTLEGIVWQETENGVLVVNVTWRGKTYVGTLLDATKHDWAPPRLNCESPTSDVDVRTPKGRGKRGRAAANNTENLDGARKLRKGRRNNSGTFTAPPSPAKSDASSQGVKRKGKVADLDLSVADGPKASKRCRSSSRGTPTGNGSAESPALIECPEPNCSKKYKHINGLRYHQTHAHQNNNGTAEDGAEDGTSTKDVLSSEESGPHSPAVSAKSDKATRSKTKRANAASNNNSNANGSSKNLDDGGEEVLARSSPRKKDDSANGAGNSSAKSSQQGAEGGSKTGKDKKDGEGHSKKGDKSANNVPISANSTDDSSKTSSSQMFQISGAPIGCLATTGVMAPPVSANQIIVSTGVASTVTTQIIAGTTVTAVPVSLPTGTTIVSVQQPLDTKVDNEKGKKSKGDKSDKLKGKSAVATRPIMPAPTTLPVGHAQLSTPAPHGLMSPTSPHTSGLKPIQPKPTIMGEPSVNPALATLAKEKKPKKKKSRDKDGQLQAQQQQQLAQQQQQQQSQHQGKGSSAHNKDVMFIKQEEVSKPESRSVIKTVPSPLKPVGEAGDPRLRDPASLPPELSKQSPVGAPGQQQQHQQPPHPKGESTTSPTSSSKGGSDQRFARPPSSLSINSPLQVSTENRERSGEVQSPAYSDISDESAPTLENETQPSVTKVKLEEGEKGGGSGGPLDGKGGDRQAEDAMSAYGMYHGYYGQPPYLIPAVPAANSSSPAAAQGGPRRTPPIKGADKELDLSGKSASARKDADRDGAKLGEGIKDGSSSSSSKPNSEDNKGMASSSSSGQPLNDYQLQQQQQQQQKLMQQQQLYYGQYYQGYVDPNYIRMMNDPVYAAQQDKLAEEQDRKAKEGGDLHSKEAASKLTDYDKNKADHAAGSRSASSTPHAQGAPLSSQGGKMSLERSSTSSSSEKGMASSKPPALISEKERKLRELDHRVCATDVSLKEKQNENHQILKENHALKAQMADGRHHKPSAAASAPNSQPSPTGTQYDNGLMERHRDDLQRYYMYQEKRMMEQQQQRADEERRKFYDPYGHHQLAAHRGRPGEAPPSAHGRPDHRDSPTSKAPHSKGDDGGPRDGRRSRDSSDGRPASKDSAGDGKHGPEGKHKDGVGAEEKRPNATPSPRTVTPKSGKEGPPGGAPMSSMQGFHAAQYLSHAYIQTPHYPPQMAFDPNHPMYRGVNPVIGYGSPAYLHPSSMRYHMSPGLEDGSEKAKLLSPGAGPDAGRKGPADHPGKALELLQQHASHYNNFGNQHKIHELQELGKGGESRNSPSKGSPDLASTAGRDKVREVSKSPPPQRHLHTHHHTHVVGPPPPGYPLYDPYGATIMTQAAAGTAASIGHPFVPK